MGITTSTLNDDFHRGSLRARLIAPLAGTTPGRLSGWSRREILRASFVAGRRGVPRLYSWIDYQKARALVALLEQGISNRRLAKQIAALDAEVEEWWKLPLLAYQNFAIVPRADSLGYTIVEKQGAADDFIRAAPFDARDISPNEAALAREVILALRDEGPLGRLSKFRDQVTMDPRVQDGQPVIVGRRIETGLLQKLHEWGATADELTDRFRLTNEQVDAALEFERAIAA